MAFNLHIKDISQAKEVKINTEDEYSGRVYSVNDLNKAFDMGLETAVIILEESIHLSQAGQQMMIKSLKNMIRRNKIKAILNKNNNLRLLQRKSIK